MAFVHTFVVAAIFSATAPPPPPHAVAHTMMFRTALASFIATAQSSTRDQRLDWTTDGCSAPIVGSTGRTFDFTHACQRHDFGYRNFKALHGGKWWTSSLRHRIDRVFQSDMYAHCAARTRTARNVCRTWAKTFYRAVRTYAGP
ncbi:MAG: hypothetical protein F2545_02615 [Actinobacteria bacterium]|uniref:Unannotated protein n=1 Tax=freshwater metagenome TaxID=449393 RepID=A0A6J6D0D3_9ZZZZ|nr:hypothetical protein [Actinomycetota bacterium]